MTIKSDDLIARDKTFDALVDGKRIPESSIPESFRVLTREFQSLGMHVELINNNGENEVNRSIVDSEIKQVVNNRVSYNYIDNTLKADDTKVADDVDNSLVFEDEE